MASLLSIGQTGLAAAQIGLSVTSNNIANAATPGYSRQSTVQVPGAAQNLGVGYVGTGVAVVDVRRTWDTLLAGRVQSATSAQAASAAFHDQIARIDDVLGNTSGGVGPAIQNLFKSIQALTTDSQSAAARQSVLSSVDSLSARFQSVSGQLSAMRSDVNAQISTAATTINSLAVRIANLNSAISRQGQGQGQPNDLLDQRDQAIADLSSQVKVSVVPDALGSYNVILGNGQPLVMGAVAAAVKTVPSAQNAADLVLAYDNAGQTVPMQDGTQTGGSVGGLIDFRSKSLDKIQNSLGQIALSLAASVNAQNRLGIDQDGKPGGDIFSVGGPEVSADLGNTSGAIAGASIVDASAVTTSDYTLKFDGTVFTVKRHDDDHVTTFTTLPGTVDGVSFNIGTGTPAAGDSFLVRPTANAAQTLTAAVVGIRKIAASAPLTTGAATSNTGSAKISGATVDASYLSAPIGTKFTLTFNAGTLSGFPDGSTATYVDGADIVFGGAHFKISGSPGSGDTFTVGPSGANSADGSNASALGALQSKNVVGSTTFQGAFATLVGWVGDKTQEMKSLSDADMSTKKSAEASLTSVSGVNLDEEAANLLKYQQSYQVASKVMATANDMFNTLLSILN
jgi:flagellar hook-associated protein 1 FlgK